MATKDCVGVIKATDSLPRFFNQYDVIVFILLIVLGVGRLLNKMLRNWLVFVVPKLILMKIDY